MKIYFDTNIYDFISATMEDEIVSSYLVENKIDLVASSENLGEVYGISDKDRCKQRLKTLITVASSFEKKPQSWWQVKEVLSEVKRIKPHWLKQTPNNHLVEQEKYYLYNHAYKWEKAKELSLPHPSDIAQYKNDFELGVKLSTLSQKDLRQQLVNNQLDLKFVSLKGGKLTELISGEILEPETFWRIDSLMVYHAAIVQRFKPSRDYADWLLPYIREDAFRSPTYSNFWVEQIKSAKVPKNMMSSLVSFYQMKYKITHGNPNDQIHACHLTDVDVFFTADKPFYKILEQVIPHFAQTSKVMLIDRGAPSAFGEIKKEIESLKI